MKAEMNFAWKARIKMTEQMLIEKVINEKLKGDAQKNALDLLDYLIANELTVDGDAPCWGNQLPGQRHWCVFLLPARKMYRVRGQFGLTTTVMMKLREF